MVYFHCESLVPLTSWQAFADVISVSKQNSRLTIIVIKTPAYHNQHITEPQAVSVQIRLIDNLISNTVKYTYTPVARGVIKIEQRVKQKEPIYIQHFTCLGAVAPVAPVLDKSMLNGHDEDRAGPSKETKHMQMVVVKHQERKLKPDKVSKPQRVHASSQTNERHLLSEDELLGYDSEEELVSGGSIVDYNQLHRYRSLMMDITSPPDAGEREEEMADTRGSWWMDFTPRGILGSVQTSSSDKSSAVPLKESDSSSSVASCDALRMMPRLLSLSLHEEGESLASEAPQSSLHGVHVDTAQEKEGNTSSLPEFTEDEVVPEPQGANNLPDLSTSKLFPARLMPKNQLVAIKKIARVHYQVEAYSLWHSLKHESLVPLLGVMKDETSVSLVLEFPDDGFLSKVGSFPLEMQVKWILQAAKGLGHLHQNGLAHQEVRPENLLISKDNTLMLSIPSNLTVARSHLEGEMLETRSLSDDRFEKLKKSDVYSFSLVVRELVNRQENSSTQSHTAFHKSSKDQLLLGMLSLMHECQHSDESQRPDILEVVRKLQNLDQHRPQTSMASGAPSVIVESASPETMPVNPLSNQSESDPQTTDSGVYLSQRPRESSRHLANLTTVCEQEDSLGSRESAFSDGSQRSKSSSSTEQVESGIPDSSSNPSWGIQAGNPKSSEEVTVTNSELKAQDAQEPDDGRKDDDKKAGSMTTDDGHEHSGGQDGDQSQRGNPYRDLGSHLCPPKMTKRIDHTGGVLKLLNGDISLEIPPGALREGQAEDITLTIDWNDQHIPSLKATELNAAPIVQCGPTGLKFEMPVLLRIPHCAVISDPKKCKMTVHYSSTHEGETPDWERMSKQDNSEIDVECKSGCFLLHVTHFCSFTVTLSSGEKTQMKELMLVAYGQEVDSFTADQEIRIYLYDFHASNRQLIHREEEYMKGKQLDGPCLYFLQELHNGKMVVTVKYHDPAWLLKSANPQTIFPFFKIWNMQSWNRCKYTWKNSAKVEEFRCHIEAKQERNEDQATLEISNHVKISPEVSSSRANIRSEHPCAADVPMGTSVNQYTRNVSFNPGCNSDSTTKQPGSYSMSESFCSQTSLMSDYSSFNPGNNSLRIIPYNLMHSLCCLLDPTDEALGNDWKRFASHFGYDSRIKNWESKKSPTLLVLQAIEQKLQIKSLKDLHDALISIDRCDAAAEVQAFMNRQDHESIAIQPSEDELMHICDTPPTNPENVSPLLTEIEVPNHMASQNTSPVGPSNMNRLDNREGSLSLSSHGTTVPGPDQTDIQTDVLNTNGHESDSLTESIQSSEHFPQFLDNSRVQPNSPLTPAGVTPSTNMHRICTNGNVNDLTSGVKRMLFSDGDEMSSNI